MQAIDERTKKVISNYYEAVVGYSEGQVILGFVSRSANLKEVRYYIKDRWRKLYTLEGVLDENIIFSNLRGNYFCDIGVPKAMLFEETKIKGQGEFPYSFNRQYEAINNFSLFDGKQIVLNKKNYKLAKYLKYSFGLEFETSQGYIPEDICFRDGLIPLRDGSITGIEYSSIVMEGNSGLNLLKQQISTLKEYTDFNKECSLHIHMGGYPLEPQVIFRLQKLWYYLQNLIAPFIPPLSFRTSEYKASGKDYCMHLRNYDTFESFYRHMVGRNYMGNLTQPHPNDITRHSKWHIPTRYYGVNFVNLLCYNVNKTVEFRFLRPTYNFNKIIWWLYFFNASMLYAEREEDISKYEHVTISDIFTAVYPNDITENLLLGLNELKCIIKNQSANNDYIGSTVHTEDALFNKKPKYI